jgi:hypothetical protein
MNCPKCNRPGCEEVIDEIDIGVGIQKHTIGFECPDCGNIGICNECGAPDFKPHSNWCAHLKEVEKQANS